MQNIAEIKKNEEKNGIEIYFKVYPLTGTKETMKKYGFRWNGKKSCWYAKYSTDTADIAGIIADTSFTEYQEIASRNGEEVKEIGEKKPTAKPKTINLDNLGENHPGSYYKTDLAKAIREDLKRRGVTGVTVRGRSITYDTGITVTIKATSEDFASIEEASARYSFNKFCADVDSRSGMNVNGRWLYFEEFSKLTDDEKEKEYKAYLREQIKKIDSVSFGNGWNDNRDYYFEFTSVFYEKVRAVYRIANQWNYDRSDSMTDYFDVGYYLDIDIKQPEEIEIRETMTDDERKVYEAEMAKRKAEEESRLQAYKEEQARREEEYKKYEAWRTAACESIRDNITIEDLAELDCLYIEGLLGGIGKEASIDELQETIESHDLSPVEARVDRIVTFTDNQAYNDFCKLFMCDFEWLKGKGGTSTADVRINDYDEYCKLTPEQRESIKFYSDNCIAVYLNDTLSLVIDPQGYGYARYVFIPGEDSHIYKADGVIAEQENESKGKPEFYFPDPVEDQITNIHEGQEITVYQCDGWILNSIYGGFGTVTGIRTGNYAQHKGVYIDLMQGKKKRAVFIRDNHKCLIYEGIMPPLPESVTESKVNERMSLLYNADDLFTNTIAYYEGKGIKPLVDTCQR